MNILGQLLQFQSLLIYFFVGCGSQNRINLQLLQVINKEIDMQFFYKILNCGRTISSSKNSFGFSKLCSKSKKNQCQDAESYRKTHQSKNSKLKSISMKIRTHMININPKKSITAKFLQLQQNYHQQTPFKNGFLIAISNNEQMPELILDDQYYSIRIGKGHQINSIKSLRQRSLDNLMIYWNYKESQNMLRDILLVNTHVSFILTGYQQIQPLINQLEHQIAFSLKDKSLHNHFGQLKCCISIFKSKIIIQLGKDLPLCKQQLKKKIKNSIGKLLDDGLLDSMMNKITITDYITMFNNPQLMVNQVLNFYQIAIDEKNQSSTNEDTNGHEKSQFMAFKQNKMNPEPPQLKMMNKDCMNNEPNDVMPNDEIKETSDLQQQANYFAASKINNQNEQSSHWKIAQEQQIQIFYFNSIKAKELPDEIIEQKETKVAFQRKFRSRSQNNKYQPEECFDDQLFEKYS